eukprot:GHUV01004823.1.p1 GENE.GHUV01004823.1~~GHUV01004823.1.p1  ORF type:complete len:219 (+),score=55.27 GHUV01004823.1:171-827(+)
MASQGYRMSCGVLQSAQHVLSNEHRLRHSCNPRLAKLSLLRVPQGQTASPVGALGSKDQYPGSWPAGMASSPQMPQQQLYPQQMSQQSLLSQTDTEYLWAGYSDLSEQLRKLHKQYNTVHDRVEELEAKLQRAQQQPPPNAWQAATFLLFFMAFINFIGMITTFNPWMFLPWMAKTPAVQSTMWLKQTLGVVVPITNTAVVLIFCLQAIKAAWTSLRW